LLEFRCSFDTGFGLGPAFGPFFNSEEETSRIVGFLDILGFGGLRLFTVKLFVAPS